MERCSWPDWQHCSRNMRLAAGVAAVAVAIAVEDRLAGCIDFVDTALRYLPDIR